MNLKSLSLFFFPLVTLLFFLNLQAHDSFSISIGDLWVRSIGPAVMSGGISTIDGVQKNPEVLPWKTGIKKHR